MAETQHHQLKHWTARSTRDFVYRLSADFAGQIETKMEKAGVNYTELAHRLGITRGRVSQVLNVPSNLTLKNTVQFARVLGMKVAVIVYEDSDPDNNKGPISPTVFVSCWRKAGAPRDFFELTNYAGIIRQFGGAAPPINGVYLYDFTSTNEAHLYVSHERITSGASTIQ